MLKVTYVLFTMGLARNRSANFTYMIMDMSKFE